MVSAGPGDRGIPKGYPNGECLWWGGGAKAIEGGSCYDRDDHQRGSNKLWEGGKSLLGAGALVTAGQPASSPESAQHSTLPNPCCRRARYPTSCCRCFHLFTPNRHAWDALEVQRTACSCLLLLGRYAGRGVDSWETANTGDLIRSLWSMRVTLPGEAAAALHGSCSSRSITTQLHIYFFNQRRPALLLWVPPGPRPPTHATHRRPWAHTAQQLSHSYRFHAFFHTTRCLCRPMGTARAITIPLQVRVHRLDVA